MIDFTRRYEIFISSTSEDLFDIRDALIRETTKLGHFPSAMELFVEAGGNVIEIINERIDKADIFVILIGARFGSIVKEGEKTYTQHEYDRAVKKNKPILAFLLDEDQYVKERNKLENNDVERKYDEDLLEFRESVKKFPDGFGRIVKFFKLNDIKGIEQSFDLALNEAINSMVCGGGWIRGELYDDLNNRIILGRSVSENHFFKQFVEKLNGFYVLSDRCVNKAPHLKKAIANYYLNRHLGKLIEANVKNIFFESGSSIAFLSEEFTFRLREDWLINVAHELEIQTNNVLTYLSFVLSEHVQIDLYPYGPPEEKYGATFGSMTAVPPREHPNEPRLLTKMAKDAIEDICNKLVSQYQENGIIFMAASGVDISGESKFPGPHVGSYYNKLFKRAILKSACPTVIFLDGTKIPSRFLVGECYSVCDQDLSWSTVCKTNPLALAIALENQDQKDQIEEYLLKNKFDVSEQKYDKKTGIYTLIATNEQYQKQFDF